MTMIHSMQNREHTRAPDLSIVIPVYRSEDCLEPLVAAIAEALDPIRRSYEVVLVNDYSPDNSWAVIQAICRRNSNVIGVDLRRNFGQDNALITGLRLARGKYVAIMDDDLQHHPNDLPALLDKIEEGADAVYADFRVKRQKWWKNLGSWFNGKVAELVVNKPKDIYLSPYKIIRKDVVEAICKYQGPDPYIDGLLFQVTAQNHARSRRSSSALCGDQHLHFLEITSRVGASRVFFFGSAYAVGQLVRICIRDARVVVGRRGGALQAFVSACVPRECRRLVFAYGCAFGVERGADVLFWNRRRIHRADIPQSQ